MAETVIWRRARNHYDFAINPRVRGYLRLHVLWRVVLYGPLFMFIAGTAVLIVGLLLWAIAGQTQRGLGIAVGLAGIASWAGLFFPIWDTWVEGRTISHDCNRLLRNPAVIHATRVEYLGGHVNFPHSRFCYLTINGQRANPHLSLHWERNPNLAGDPPLHVPPWSTEHPSISLRDIDRPDATTDPDFDPLVMLERRFGGRVGLRDALQVRYNGPASRRFVLELANVVGGQDGVRLLRNTIVCAIAEAEEEIVIKTPWKSLPLIDNINPPEEVSDDRAAWRGFVPPGEWRRAFRRV